MRRQTRKSHPEAPTLPRFRPTPQIRVKFHPNPYNISPQPLKSPAPQPLKPQSRILCTRASNTFLVQTVLEQRLNAFDSARRNQRQKRTLLIRGVLKSRLIWGAAHVRGLLAVVSHIEAQAALPLRLVPIR